MFTKRRGMDIISEVGFHDLSLWHLNHSSSHPLSTDQHYCNSHIFFSVLQANICQEYTKILDAPRVSCVAVTGPIPQILSLHKYSYSDTPTNISVDQVIGMESKLSKNNKTCTFYASDLVHPTSPSSAIFLLMFLN
jgi:hypothetical protein